MRTLVWLTGATPSRCGCLTVVQILAGCTSDAGFVLEDDVNRGGLELEIVPDLKNPVDIALVGDQAELAIGTDMAVEAVTSSPSAYSYHWYLHGGVLAGETNPIMTIGENLGNGVY